jgi:NAD(P)-dependent dehydrogenase (short-subunit alcohol dehydrogenase family)
MLNEHSLTDLEEPPMSWTTDNIPDLTGKVAAVTGANGGPGSNRPRRSPAPGHVVIAGRNQTTAEAARDDILAVDPDSSLEILPLDLGSLESVRQAAATIAATHPVVDILLNNAGVMAMREGSTVDGFETQLGIDHLGHRVLTARLLGPLLATDAARVATVTSTAHHYGRAISTRTTPSWKAATARGGRIKMKCACPDKHMKMVHLTPRDTYAKNLIRWLERRTCWKDEA